MQGGGAIEVFRTERNNNLDARSALRLSPQSCNHSLIEQCHNLSQIVTECDTPDYCRGTIGLSAQCKLFSGPAGTKSAVWQVR